MTDQKPITQDDLREAATLLETLTAGYMTHIADPHKNAEIVQKLRNLAESLKPVAWRVVLDGTTYEWHRTPLPICLHHRGRIEIAYTLGPTIDAARRKP